MRGRDGGPCEAKTELCIDVAQRCATSATRPNERCQCPRFGSCGQASRRSSSVFSSDFQYALSTRRWKSSCSVGGGLLTEAHGDGVLPSFSSLTSLSAANKKIQARWSWQGLPAASLGDARLLRLRAQRGCLWGGLSRRRGAEPSSAHAHARLVSRLAHGVLRPLGGGREPEVHASTKPGTGRAQCLLIDSAGHLCTNT